MRASAIFVIILALGAVAARAMAEPCLAPGEIAKVVASMNGTSDATNSPVIKKELIALREDRRKLVERATGDPRKAEEFKAKAVELGNRGIARVCEIWKTNGWLGRGELEDDGFDALQFLITNTTDVEKLRSALPVLMEAAKRNLVARPFIASVVDTIRIGFGAPQIFGTKARIADNVVYIYPLLNAEKVDAWRDEYKMPPLSQQIRMWTSMYQLPVVQSQRRAGPPQLRKGGATDPKDPETAALGLDDDNAALVVETKVVNLNVRLLTRDLKEFESPLTKDDFIVMEDSAAQQITYFRSTEQPFDLVLLLDFSGSTESQRGLVKKAAQRFVDAVRADDRVAVVVFASDIVTIADYSSDKEAVKKKIDKIDIGGGSPIWDALAYTYENVIKKSEPGRRTAIVFMTDGQDFSRKATFTDAMEYARRGDTTIFPIYIGRSDAGGMDNLQRMYRNAEQSLWLLGEESGGTMYRAKTLGDLKGIYEQVARAVGRVYTLSYEPEDDTRDGSWREVNVSIKGHPELVVRTRRGYYAN